MEVRIRTKDGNGFAGSGKQRPSDAREISLASCNAFWIGERLGPIAVACLRSFARAGHEVVLHVYDEPGDVPDGVIVRDAGLLVPADQVFRHQETGSYALFADFFRYKLLAAGQGLYIDCDVVCVRPILGDAEVVCGWQSAEKINCAVLKLPPDSPVLVELLELFDKRVFAPPWFSLRQQVRQIIKGLVGYKADVTHAHWGSAGPDALTWHMKAQGLESLAQPPEVFYPVPYLEADIFLDADVKWDDIITDRTLCVHLWNEIFRRKSDYKIPKGSPLRLLLDGDWPPPVARSPALSP